MSKCFGKFAKTKESVPSEDKLERNRQRYESWETSFKNPEQYIDFKLRILRDDMYIEPTETEVLNLRCLKTMGDIDRAVQTIIKNHWG